MSIAFRSSQLRVGDRPSSLSLAGLTRLAATILFILLCSPALAQSSPSAYTSATRYDAERRVVGTIAPDPDGAGALQYTAVRNTYDSAGRVIKVEKGVLSSWQSESLAPANWGAAFTVQQSTITTYDALDRKLKDSLWAGGSLRKVMQYSYDSFGRLDCTAERMDSTQWNTQTDACVPQTAAAQGPDRISRNVYDLAGQLVQVRQGVGTASERAGATYNYTLNGKRDYVIDAEGARAELTWDGFDRQDKWVFPALARPAAYDDTSQASALASAGALNAADFEQYVYDANGNRTSLRKRDARTLKFAYDALNRVTSKCVTSGASCVMPAATTGRDVYYSYDLLGHQLATRFDSATGTDAIVNGYNSFGELNSSTITMGTFSKSLSALYDANGNRTQLTDPAAQKFTYTYDGLNRLSGILLGLSGGTLLDTFVYNDAGLIGSRSESGGSGVTYTYDTIDRLTASRPRPTTSAGRWATIRHRRSRPRCAPTMPTRSAALSRSTATIRSTASTSTPSRARRASPTTPTATSPATAPTPTSTMPRTGWSAPRRQASPPI
jgi:YD repeat-containing protein